MTSKRFTKRSLQLWLEMEKLVPPEEKAKFLAFKARSDNYYRRVMDSPPEPPPIDWERYKKSVPIPGLVDKFKSEYTSLKIPYPQDTQSAEIDKQWADLQKQIQAFCAERDKDIAEANKELNKIKALPNFDDITMEMAIDMYPELCIQPVKKPSFWPHNPEEQHGYKDEKDAAPAPSKKPLRKPKS